MTELLRPVRIMKGTFFSTSMQSAREVLLFDWSVILDSVVMLMSLQNNHSIPDDNVTFTPVILFQTLPIFRSLPVSFPPGFSIPKSFLILNIDRGTDGSARIKGPIDQDLVFFQNKFIYVPVVRRCKNQCISGVSIMIMFQSLHNNEISTSFDSTFAT